MSFSSCFSIHLYNPPFRIRPEPDAPRLDRRWLRPGFRAGAGRLRSPFPTADGGLGLAGGAALTFSLVSISLASTSTGSAVIPEAGDDTGGVYHADFGTKTGFLGCDSKCGDMIWAPYSLNASSIRRVQLRDHDGAILSFFQVSQQVVLDVKIRKLPLQHPRRRLLVNTRCPRRCQK